jgi:Fe-Mn family superoxide dismutase
MAYEPKNFEGLLGMEGFSDTLLKNHFTLYSGYATNTNKVADLLSSMMKDGRIGTPEYAELKRRFGWEFNGMRMHEYYFVNLKKGGSALPKDSSLYKKIVQDFGSYEGWEKDFRAVGAMRGIGWVVLYQDKLGDRLFNMWVNEHDVGHPAGCKPKIVMDVFEHAYMTDYGLKRADYINAFFKSLSWEKAAATFEKG